jgi:polysaccharide export outer membrane protein
MRYAPTTLCLALIVLTASASALAGQTQDTAPVPSGATTPAEVNLGLQDYRIGPEDVLDVMVWKNPELTRSVVVRPDGRISLPLLNDITAAGLTPMELRKVLADGYSKYVNAAEVSVVVSEIQSFTVSVVGMVRTAGRYRIGRELTVLDALALAGGLNEFAKRDRIVVLRPEGRGWKRFGFDYTTATQYDSSHNFALRPRDIVVVP